MAIDAKSPLPSDGEIKGKEVKLTIRPTTDFKPLSLPRPGGSSFDVQLFEENAIRARWVGKCSEQAASKPHVLVPYKSRYYEEYKEWLGLSIYQLCDIATPQVTLSAQPVLKATGTAGELAGLDEDYDYVNPCLHIMSEFIPRFQTCGAEFLANYITYAREQKAHFQMTPADSKVPIPLRGFGAALAVADFIYDGDCVGRDGRNIGYVVKTDANGDSYAAVVKIDAGWAFSFLENYEDKDYEHKPGDRAVRLAPGKDRGRLFSLHYDQLTQADQREFVATAQRILALPWIKIETLARQTICPDGLTIDQANTLLEKLLYRKKIFLMAFSPEVSTQLRTGIQQEREAVLARWQKERMTFTPTKERSSEKESKQEIKDNVIASSFTSASDCPSETLFELENKEGASVQLQAQLGEMVAEGKIAEKKRTSPICRSFQISEATQYFTGRQDLLAELTHQLHDNQRPRSIFSFFGGRRWEYEVVTRVICGLGGVGKTQLATRYVELALQKQSCGKYSLEYQGIIWLYAERDLSSQFSELADAWFNIKGLSPEETLIALHQRLRYERILIVLDNAKEDIDLKSLLKIFQGGCYHILVTSRNPDWDKIAVFNLSGFSKEEGIAYVRKQLPDTPEENLFALLESVSYLPLALSHAVAYIREGYCTLAEYPRQFALHQLSLGGSATASESGQTVMTTFLLSLARLSERYPAAEAILKACAHFAPENIPLDLLQLHFVGKEAGQYSQDIFQASVAALVRQSLLQPTGAAKGFVNMHRLVQRTMREWGQQTESTEQKRVYLQSWVRCFTVRLASLDERDGIKLCQQDYLIPHVLHLTSLCTLESGAEDIDLAMLLNKIGCHQRVLAHYFSAQQAHERALSITKKHYGAEHPKVVEALVQLAVSYNNDFQSDKIKPLMQEVLCIQEKFPNSETDIEELGRKGLVLQFLGHFEKALSYYAQALTIQPDHVKTLINRGGTLITLRRFMEALSDLDRALLLMPNDRTALTNRLATFVYLNRFEEALIDIKKFLSLGPECRIVLVYQITSLTGLNQLTEALEICDKILLVKPNDKIILAKKGIILGKLGHLSEIHATYKKILALQPEDNSTLIDYGYALKVAGYLDEALKIYDQAVALKPSWETWGHRGDLLSLCLGRFEEAVESYNKCLAFKLAPEQTLQVLNNRGVALRNLGRYEEAQTDFEGSLVIKPDNFASLANYAFVLYKLGHLAEALSHCKKSLKLRPKDAQTLYWQGLTLEGLGRYLEALESFKQSLNENPNDVAVVIAKTSLEAGLTGAKQSLSLEPTESKASNPNISGIIRAADGPQFAATNAAVSSTSLENSILESKQGRLPASQAQLAQTVYEFVIATQAYLDTQKEHQWDPQAATSFVAGAVKVLAKGEAEYHSLLAHSEDYSIPANVSNFFDHYVNEHPVLKELVHHPDFAYRLKNALNQGKIVDIVREFYLSILGTKAPAKKDAFFDKNTKPNESSGRNISIEKDVVKNGNCIIC